MGSDEERGRVMGDDAPYRLSATTTTTTTTNEVYEKAMAMVTMMVGGAKSGSWMTEAPSGCWLTKESIEVRREGSARQRNGNGKWMDGWILVQE